MEISVRELCLVCGGERWIPDPAGQGRSRPCPDCDAQGWVDVSPACLPPPSERGKSTAEKGPLRQPGGG
jgi:hypothetical protein